VTPTSIKVQGLSKQYVIGGAEQHYDSFRDMFTNVLKNPWQKYKKLRGHDQSLERFFALKNINFEIKQGEIVGIIGHNGAGKSTLLKVLSRITSPTTGKIEVHGRVASLLEVGTGFHPELTGRENIFLNGSILGMKRSEIRQRFDEIVEFAGVQKFLDTPVKRYSSGMYVRLAFSVAAHLDSDVLLVDEVLSVGDQEFQKKCLGKLGDISSQGRTVIFISHNLSSVSSLCDRGILLSSGQVSMDGPIDAVLTAYNEEIHSGGETVQLSDKKPALIKLLKFVNSENRENVIRSGESCQISVDVDCYDELKEVVLEVGFYDQKDQRLTLLSSYSEMAHLTLKKGTNSFSFDIESLPLVSGSYYLNIAIVRNKDLLDVLVRAVRFSVKNDSESLAQLNSHGPMTLKYSHYQK